MSTTTYVFLYENISCGYSLEAPQWGASNEYHNICFCAEIRKKTVCGHPLLFRAIFSFFSMNYGIQTQQLKLQIRVSRFIYLSQRTTKPCETSKDSDQPVHPPSMARVLVHHSLDSLEAVESTCDKRRLWFVCTDHFYFHYFFMKTWVATSEMYLWTCVSSKDSDQPVHLSSLIRIFTRCILDTWSASALFVIKYAKSCQKPDWLKIRSGRGILIYSA